MAGAQRQDPQGLRAGPQGAAARSRFRLTVPAAASGSRVDQFLVSQRPSLSRAQVQRLIRDGLVRVEGLAVRPGHRVRKGERLEVTIPKALPSSLLAEEMPLGIVYEDQWVLVLDKPAGLTVHPGAGRTHGTVVNALLAHWAGFGEMGDAVRPGIVHRLDKGTSGLMVVAKDQECQRRLAEQLARRELERRYLALVWGVVREPEGRIDVPIGRHLLHRQKMAPAGVRRREAVTEYWTLERYAEMSLVECRLLTGRTHQIRVHCQWIGHPVVGDPDYGGVRRRQWGKLSPQVGEALAALPSQALHAYRLRLAHPATGQVMVFTSQPRQEMLELLSALGSRVVDRLVPAQEAAD